MSIELTTKLLFMFAVACEENDVMMNGILDGVDETEDDDLNKKSIEVFVSLCHKIKEETMKKAIVGSFLANHLYEARALVFIFASGTLDADLKNAEELTNPMREFIDAFPHFTPLN